ncbi:MAG: adenosine deaminase [Casimicrobiaceae bacterium]
MPEVVGFLAPDWVDLYATHPAREQLDAERKRYRLDAPAAIWVITTEGERTDISVGKLRAWHAELQRTRTRATGQDAAVPELVIWRAEGTDNLASPEECRRWRELAFRVLLLAHETVGPDGAVDVSLAGGRKTMSSDLQDAAYAFSARSLLHVVADDATVKKHLSNPSSLEAFLSPLAPEVVKALNPVVINQPLGEPAVRTAVDGQALRGADFPLPQGGEMRYWLPDGFWLQDAVADRRQNASRLLVTQALATGEKDPYEPWPILLRLDPARIDRLRAKPLTAPLADPLADPKRWPLADLHRHLGGCLDPQAQQSVADQVLKNTEAPLRQAAEDCLCSCWPEAAAGRAAEAPPVDWPKRLRAAAAALSTRTALGEPRARAVVTSLVLLRHDLAELERLLWPPAELRLALKSRHPLGFAAYERPGELSGSALLGHPAAVEPYAAAVVRALRAEGLLYAELRGSPHKYWPDNPVGFIEAFEAALRLAGADTDGREPSLEAPRLGFIWIVDRRQLDDPVNNVEAVVAAAVKARAQHEHFVLGLDLAGDEGTNNPEKLASKFAPALVECMRITIHAGEGESVDNIWQAAYHLHADRIGHGLTLPQNPRLAARFRDRGIALELCPSSNREVVGFADAAVPQSDGLPPYPLGEMMAAGLPLTINTDNPAISRTTVAQEFATAARMCDALTPWRALALLRLSYRHAFVPAAERLRLERRAAKVLAKLAADPVSA